MRCPNCDANAPDEGETCSRCEYPLPGRRDREDAPQFVARVLTLTIAGGVMLMVVFVLGLLMWLLL